MHSREEQRKQKTPNGACLQEVTVKPPGPAKGPSPSPAQGGASPRGGQGNGLMEQVVARDNMWAALERVEENGGAGEPRKAGYQKLLINRLIKRKKLSKVNGCKVHEWGTMGPFTLDNTDRSKDC